MLGTVMRFDPERGYGFIRPDEGGKDLFLHVSELRHIDPHAIRERVTRVEYSEADSGRGPKAVNVYLADGEPEPGAPALATEAQWAALWFKVSAEAFNALMAAARANGWVQDEPV